MSTHQTHGATPQTPARDPRREQAAKLRELAAQRESIALGCERHHYPDAAAWVRVEAAALLAGAAAIEAQGQSRDAIVLAIARLDEVAGFGTLANFDATRKVMVALQAALARLEAL